MLTHSVRTLGCSNTASGTASCPRSQTNSSGTTLPERRTPARTSSRSAASSPAQSVRCATTRKPTTSSGVDPLLTRAPAAQTCSWCACGRRTAGMSTRRR
eukprot:scaffold55535_cov62-Phaeocystis_antarctica.AAC.1